MGNGFDLVMLNVETFSDDEAEHADNDELVEALRAYNDELDALTQYTIDVAAERSLLFLRMAERDDDEAGRNARIADAVGGMHGRQVVAAVRKGREERARRAKMV